MVIDNTPLIDEESNEQKKQKPETVVINDMPLIDEESNEQKPEMVVINDMPLIDEESNKQKKQKPEMVVINDTAPEKGNKGVITDKHKLKSLKEMKLENRERKSLPFQFTEVTREVKGKEHDKDNNESGKGENIIDAHDDMIKDHD